MNDAANMLQLIGMPILLIVLFYFLMIRPQQRRMKQHQEMLNGLKRNDVVTVTVLEVRDGGLEVQAGDDGATGFIKRSDLGRDLDEQRPDRFKPGQKVDAMVIGFDRPKKPNFSIKARQIAEEKQAVEQYGSSDSGASLGDILGEALKTKQ